MGSISSWSDGELYLLSALLDGPATVLFFFFFLNSLACRGTIKVAVSVLDSANDYGILMRGDAQPVRTGFHC